MTPLVVGLTGGIACGKTTVAAILQDHGVPVLDLDQVSRAVVQPGMPALQEIAMAWPSVIGSDGGLDRKALGIIITNSESDRLVLERILHPYMFSAQEDWIRKQTAPYVVIESAILFESHSDPLYDFIVTVFASHDIQLARLMTRNGHNAETAEKWIAMQMSLDEKLCRSHATLRNDGNIEDLLHGVATLCRTLERRSSEVGRVRVGGA